MKVSSNGLEIEVETAGEGEPLVMIMGLGAQLVLWPQPFCEMLHQRGFRTIRLDNRDVGRSTWSKHPVPDIRKALVRSLFGVPVPPPYTLDEMADDVAGVLDQLGIERAHVMGASMGGMIAQCFALRHAHRVKSLVSIMSTSGERRFGWRVRPSALKALMGTVPKDREQAGERLVNTFKIIGGPGYPLDEDSMREIGRTAFDRGSNPAGFVRQFAAILAAPPRGERLKSLRVPSLVIHGSDDPLVHVAAGRHTARCIPGAWMLELAGMGHHMPGALWQVMVDAVTANAQRS